MSKITVLLTNDDGYQAAGLRELATMLHWDSSVDLWIVAPYENRTGSSHAISLGKKIKIAKKKSVENLTTYVVDGTPADCVYLAVQKFMPKKPDLIISGINHGGNFGRDIYYSGTVGAAREGAIYGIPSFAVSHDAVYEEGYAYDHLAWLVHNLILQTPMWKGLRAFEYMNINIPKKVNFDKVKESLDYAYTQLAVTSWGGEITLTHCDNPNSLTATLGNERHVFDKTNSENDFNTVRLLNKISITKLTV